MLLVNTIFNDAESLKTEKKTTNLRNETDLELTLDEFFNVFCRLVMYQEKFLYSTKDNNHVGYRFKYRVYYVCTCNKRANVNVKESSKEAKVILLTIFAFMISLWSLRRCSCDATTVFSETYQCPMFQTEELLEPFIIRS